MIPNSDASWASRTSKAVLLIRILVGWVFLPEGIQKFKRSNVPLDRERSLAAAKRSSRAFSR
jgi:uncharacterized membrane protein YphA (DoxX/SURF4 family)